MHRHWIGPLFVFDDAQETANRLKHGISLRQAEFADWRAAHVEPDMRHGYGEVRLTCRVPINAHSRGDRRAPRTHVSYHQPAQGQ